MRWFPLIQKNLSQTAPFEILLTGEGGGIVDVITFDASLNNHVQTAIVLQTF